MTPHELKVLLDWLGLDQRGLAEVLAVSERTVRRWVAGDSPVPAGVIRELADLEARTDAEVLAAGAVEADPAEYATDEDLWAARPDIDPLPVGWWRMVVARARIIRRRPAGRTWLVPIVVRVPQHVIGHLESIADVINRDGDRPEPVTPESIAAEILESGVLVNLVDTMPEPRKRRRAPAP